VFADRLASLGAEVITLPAIRSAPCPDPAALDAALHELAVGGQARPAYDWLIFTSANAVAAFLDRLFALGAAAAPSRRYDARSLAGVRLAAIGPTTAAALHPYGLAADLVSEGSTGRHLAAALPDITGQRVLLPRSDQAMPELPAALAARGAQVTEVVAYAVVPAAPDPDALAALTQTGVDVASFFSPSALRGLAEMLGRPLAEALGNAAIACVGPTTATAARAMGLQVDIVPEETTAEGLMDALIKWRRDR
jgi:uroporphyrinogen III methyltransferase/synthase